jgi:hypothetical protein
MTAMHVGRGAIGLILVGVAGVAIGATTFAGAEPTVADGQVHSCAGKPGVSDGALRVVSVGERCRSTEIELPWQVAGAPGRIGASGASGPPGRPGATGPSTNGVTAQQVVQTLGDSHLTNYAMTVRTELVRTDTRPGGRFHIRRSCPGIRNHAAGVWGYAIDSYGSLAPAGDIHVVGTLVESRNAHVWFGDERGLFLSYFKRTKSRKLLIQWLCVNKVDNTVVPPRLTILPPPPR